MYQDFLYYLENYREFKSLGGGFHLIYHFNSLNLLLAKYDRLFWFQKFSRKLRKIVQEVRDEVTFA